MRGAARGLVAFFCGEFSLFRSGEAAGGGLDSGQEGIETALGLGVEWWHGGTWEEGGLVTE